MRKPFFIPAMLIAGMMSTSALAAEAKIVFVDVKSAIENTKAYQEGIQRLESIKKNKQKELDGLRDRINQAESDLLGQSMAMSPERLAQKQEDLNALRKTFTRRQQDAQEELMREKNRLDQGVLTDFYDVVRAYGKEHGYDLILQKQSAVIYGAKSHDITGEITKALDKK